MLNLILFIESSKVLFFPADLPVAKFRELIARLPFAAIQWPNYHYFCLMMKECLLIDDDLDDQEIFKMCIRKISAEINCIAADDGLQAIKLLESSDAYIPDYIFLDVNMPKMNGMECLKVLRSLERLNSAKIYMYSTTSGLEAIKESKRLGADDFIVKPSKTAELKEKLSNIFEIVSRIQRNPNE